jgi:hypothetical protein
MVQLALSDLKVLLEMMERQVLRALKALLV